MMRRLVLVLLFLTWPLLAKQRAVMAGAAGHCTTGVVAREVVTELVTTDDRYVFWFDFFRELHRVSKQGGATQKLGVIRDGAPRRMTVDDTHVYVSVERFNESGAPRPGAILTIPKSGGAVRTLIAEVSLPFDLETDATHVYWADAGVIDPQTNRFVTLGRIERARKDGSGRETLADYLAAPYHLALDGDLVWFSESGFALDDSRAGLRVVPKSGGVVTPVGQRFVPGGIAPAGDSVLAWGFNSEVDNAIFAFAKDGSGMRILVQSERVISRPRVFDGVAYYLTRDGQNANTLWSVPVAGGAPALLYDHVSIYVRDVAVDSCAITIPTAPHTIVRLKR